MASLDYTSRCPADAPTVTTSLKSYLNVSVTAAPVDSPTSANGSQFVYPVPSIVEPHVTPLPQESFISPSDGSATFLTDLTA